MWDNIFYSKKTRIVPTHGVVEKETTAETIVIHSLLILITDFIWINSTRYETNLGRGLVTSAISTFRDAYLYTGNDIYAKAGLILLNRVFDFYLVMLCL